MDIETLKSLRLADRRIGGIASVTLFQTALVNAGPHVGRMTSIVASPWAHHMSALGLGYPFQELLGGQELREAPSSMLEDQRVVNTIALSFNRLTSLQRLQLDFSPIDWVDHPGTWLSFRCLHSCLTSHQAKQLKSLSVVCEAILSRCFAADFLRWVVLPRNGPDGTHDFLQGLRELSVKIKPYHNNQ